LSHIVHHLSFGNRLTEANINRLSGFIGKEYFDKGSLTPMDGDMFVNLKQHQAFHHYIKVCFADVGILNVKNVFFRLYLHI
jgi:hypothetical protein